MHFGTKNSYQMVFALKIGTFFRYKQSMRNVSTKNKMTLCHGLMEYQQFDFLNEKMNFDTLWSPIFQGVNERCE